MRKIKFRALNVDNQFIYGLPYTDSVNETLYYKDYNNRLCWRNEMGSSCNQAYKNGTLEQFTGLHDNTKWEDLTEKEKNEWLKNLGNTSENWPGKEIYEGDIISWGLDYIKVVKYEIIKKSIVYGQGLSGIEVISGFYYDGYYGKIENCEIIGNIHENKELLP